MKKNFLLLFCFISSFVFSQEYHFDYFIEQTRISREKYTSFKFYNSKTRHFFFVSRINQKFIGSLNDTENKLLHYFYIYEKDGNYTAVYSDSYLHDSTVKENYEDNKSTGHNNIEIHKITELHYTVNFLRKNKSKKIWTSLDILLENSEYNFSEIFVDSPENSSITTLLENEINKNGCCYRITNYKVIYKKNNVVSVLNSFKKVYLKLVIPDKLNLKHLQSSNNQ